MISRFGEAIYWTKSHGLYYTIILLPYLFCRLVLGSHFTYSKEAYLSALGVSKEKVFWIDFDSYEKNVKKAVITIHGNVFIDIGAHLGQYPILLWRNFRKIVAIEPYPDNFKSLRSNLDKEELSGVICLQMAISDNIGIETLYVGDFDGHTLEEKRYKSLPRHNNNKISVHTTTIDELIMGLREGSLGRVELVKIDVEGSEARVLSGARESLKAGLIENIVVEVHAPVSSQAIEDFLKEYNFHIHWLDSHHIFGELQHRAS